MKRRDIGLNEFNGQSMFLPGSGFGEPERNPPSPEKCQTWKMFCEDLERQWTFLGASGVLPNF